MADIDKTLSELGTSVKIEGPDKEVELEKVLGGCLFKQIEAF